VIHPSVKVCTSAERHHLVEEGGDRRRRLTNGNRDDAKREERDRDHEKMNRNAADAKKQIARLRRCCRETSRDRFGFFHPERKPARLFPLPIWEEVGG